MCSTSNVGGSWQVPSSPATLWTIVPKSPTSTHQCTSMSWMKTLNSHHVPSATMTTTKNCYCHVMDVALIIIRIVLVLTTSLVCIGFATPVPPNERWRASIVTAMLADHIGLLTGVHVLNSDEKGLESKLRTLVGPVCGNRSGTV